VAGKYLLMKTPFAVKSYSFALSVVAVCRSLMENRKEFILSRQFLRSGSAIGALYREAQHAESRADFIHKLAIAQKECNESIYWIDILHDSKYLNSATYLRLSTDANELMSILTAMIKTAKANAKKG
jgi:four helix bundle protein